jgi:hypothetical protein
VRVEPHCEAVQRRCIHPPMGARAAEGAHGGIARWLPALHQIPRGAEKIERGEEKGARGGAIFSRTPTPRACSSCGRQCFVSLVAAQSEKEERKSE